MEIARVVQYGAYGVMALAAGGVAQVFASGRFTAYEAGVSFVAIALAAAFYGVNIDRRVQMRDAITRLHDVLDKNTAALEKVAGALNRYEDQVRLLKEQGDINAALQKTLESMQAQTERAERARAARPRRKGTVP